MSQPATNTRVTIDTEPGFAGATYRTLLDTGQIESVLLLGRSPDGESYHVVGERVSPEVMEELLEVGVMAVADDAIQARARPGVAVEPPAMPDTESIGLVSRRDGAVLTLAYAWAALEAQVYHHELDPKDRAAKRQAFYCGAAAVFALVSGGDDPQAGRTVARGIDKEISDFLQGLQEGDV